MRSGTGLRRLLSFAAASSVSSFKSAASAATSSAQIHPHRKARQSVRRILHLLSTDPSHSENLSLSKTLSLLKTSPHSLSPTEASTLISTIADPIISFYFYRFLRSLLTFKPNSTLFVSLIISQLKSINPHLPKIQFFLKESSKHNVNFSAREFRELFEISVPNYLEIAELLIRVLLEERQFNECSYDFAISAYAKHGFCGKAIVIAERVRSRCENPSLSFYHSLMGVYMKREDARAAIELYFEMQEKGVVANEDIYRVLVEIFCGVGWVKLCWVLVQDMVKAGFTVNGSLSLNLVRNFLKLNMISEAEYLFIGGLVKDNDSLGVLVETLAEKGKPWVGFNMIEKMFEFGLEVDGSVYACLVRGCGKIGLLEDAERIFSKTRSCIGIVNMQAVYISMIYVYSRAGIKKLAEMVWHEMETLIGYKVSEEACILMMSMYRALGLMEDVLKLFDLMKRSDCHHHVSIDVYVILIDASTKLGKLTQARDLLFEMRSSGIYPNNQIYSLMLEGYLQVGLVNHAIALVDENKRFGLEIDDVASTSFVKVLIKTGRYIELESYLDKLAVAGIQIPRDKGANLMKKCANESCLRKLSRMIQ